MKKATIVIVCMKAMATTRTMDNVLFRFSMDLTYAPYHNPDMKA
jgi:hypothetical protein